MQNLAIIIPFYKIHFFEDTIESIAKQTNRNFNLYIGNDASPHNPIPIIEKYLDYSGYTYIKYENNLGGKNLVAHWERLLTHIKEDWFIILGDDDVLELNFVEEFHKNINKVIQNNCFVIKASHCQIDENNTVIEPYKKFNQKLLDPLKILYTGPSSLSEHLFSTKKYREIGFTELPLAWCTDNLAVIEISDGKPIYFLNEAKVKVRMSDENISGKKDNNEIKDQSRITFEKILLNKYFKRLNNKVRLELIDRQWYYYYHKKIPLKINLFKIYSSTQSWNNLIKIPIKYIQVKFHHLKNAK